MESPAIPGQFRGSRSEDEALLHGPIIADCTKKERLLKMGLAEMEAVVVSLGENVSASTLVTLF
jgi:Trk K+ transport system NAD-binding subunit